MLRGHRLRRHVPVEYVGQSTRMQAAKTPWHLVPRRRQAYLNAGAGTEANRKRKKEEAGMRQEVLLAGPCDRHGWTSPSPRPELLEERPRGSRSPGDAVSYYELAR
jgi:hypothetical protein